MSGLDLSGFMPEDEDDERVKRVRRELGEKLDRSSFPGEEQARSLWSVAMDQGYSWSKRALAVAALLYFVIPLDLIPDFLSGAGLLDDLAVIASAYLTVCGSEE